MSSGRRSGLARRENRWPTLLVSVALLGAMSGACGEGGANDRAIVTFEVAGGEQFKVELVTPELIDHARQLLNGENVSAIPIGTVVRNDPGVNAPWSWHLDPTTFEFAFATVEVCDGIPSFVEDGTVTSDAFCPWSATVVAVDPAP